MLDYLACCILHVPINLYNNKFEILVNTFSSDIILLDHFVGVGHCSALYSAIEYH
jgi:hypothetical protein